MPYRIDLIFMMILESTVIKLSSLLNGASTTEAEEIIIDRYQALNKFIINRLTPDLRKSMSNPRICHRRDTNLGMTSSIRPVDYDTSEIESLDINYRERFCIIVQNHYAPENFEKYCSKAPRALQDILRYQRSQLIYNYSADHMMETLAKSLDIGKFSISRHNNDLMILLTEPIIDRDFSYFPLPEKSTLSYILSSVISQIRFENPTEDIRSKIYMWSKPDESSIEPGKKKGDGNHSHDLKKGGENVSPDLKKKMTGPTLDTRVICLPPLHDDPGSHH